MTFIAECPVVNCLFAHNSDGTFLTTTDTHDKPAKKRIVLIGPAYPYRGGNALFMSHLHEALATDFTILHVNYSTLYPSLLFPGTTQLDESKNKTLRVPNQRWINSANPLSWPGVARKILQFEPDLVVFDWWQPYFGLCHRVIAAGIKKQGIPILTITENVISHEARGIDRWLTSHGLKHAGAFLTLSALVEKDLQPYQRGRKVYRSELPIYSFYDSDDAGQNAEQERGALREQVGVKEESELLLFFGYVRKYKGLDVLLKAMPDILKQRPLAHLLIVGEFYDNEGGYRDLIESLNLQNDVTIVSEFVPNEEVGMYYTMADLVVLPYKEATQSGILNIAYAFAKPVVVTNVGGLSEFVDERTGVVVEPENPTLLAEGIVSILPKAVQGAYAQGVQQKASENGFKNIAKLFANIVEEMA